MSYLSVARGLGVAGSAAPAQATRGTSVGAAAPPRRARLSLRASSETEAATRAETWEFCMTREALLASPNRRAQGDINGIGKVALFWYKNEPYAVQGNCPHLGIPLAGGQLTSDGKLVCSQHKSSWEVKTGEVDKWLPGNFINAFQRAVSPACPLETFECKIEDDNIYVKVP